LTINLVHPSADFCVLNELKLLTGIYRSKNFPRGHTPGPQFEKGREGTRKRDVGKDVEVRGVIVLQMSDSWGWGSCFLGFGGRTPLRGDKGR